jgi:hypothetical protein
MDDNVVVVGFGDQSKAYQALSQLRQGGRGRAGRGPFGCVAGAGIRRRCAHVEGGDAASGIAVASGGLLGVLIGVLGGPLGVLLGGYAGGVGAAARTEIEAWRSTPSPSRSSPPTPCSSRRSGEVATEVVDNAMKTLDGTVIRRSAAEVSDEIQPAEAAQEAADAEARRVLREQRRAEQKDKWELFKNKIKSTVE